MKLSEMEPGQKVYTQLGHRVLAVLSRRHDGWCISIGAGPGQRHDVEWMDVAAHGDKVREPVAIAIAKEYFHPGFEIDVEYAQ